MGRPVVGRGLPAPKRCCRHTQVLLLTAAAAPSPPSLLPVCCPYAPSCRWRCWFVHSQMSWQLLHLNSHVRCCTAVCRCGQAHPHHSKRRQQASSHHAQPRRAAALLLVLVLLLRSGHQMQRYSVSGGWWLCCRYHRSQPVIRQLLSCTRRTLTSTSAPWCLTASALQLQRCQTRVAHRSCH